MGGREEETAPLQLLGLLARNITVLRVETSAREIRRYPPPTQQAMFPTGEKLLRRRRRRQLQFHFCVFAANVNSRQTGVSSSSNSSERGELPQRESTPEERERGTAAANYSSSSVVNREEAAPLRAASAVIEMVLQQRRQLDEEGEHNNTSGTRVHVSEILVLFPLFLSAMFLL